MKKKNYIIYGRLLAIVCYFIASVVLIGGSIYYLSSIDISLMENVIYIIFAILITLGFTVSCSVTMGVVI